MIHCILHLQAYFPQVAAEFCEFDVERVDALVAVLRAKLASLREAQILRSDELKVSLEFVNLHRIPKLDSEILVAFVRGQEELLCRLELRGSHLDALEKLQHLVDAAFLAAVKARMLQFKPEPKFALSHLFAKGRPAPSLIKVIRNPSSPLLKPSPPSAPIVLSEVKALAIPDVPYGLLMDYQNSNHPAFQPWRAILNLMSQSIIEKIVHHLGEGGLQYLCQHLQILTLDELVTLLRVFFRDEAENNLFFLCFPNGIQYLSVLETWPREVRAHFFQWCEQSTKPLDFFEAVQEMQHFWQTLAPLSPDIALPNTPKSDKDFNLTQHLNTLGRLMQMVGEPYQTIQASLIFDLSYRPQVVYENLLQNLGWTWVSEEMFALDAPVCALDFYQPLMQASKAYCFQYLGQHLQDYSHQFKLIFSYASFIEGLTLDLQPFAWSLAAWVGGSLQLMTLPQFQQLYAAFSEVADQDLFLKLIFSLPARYRPTYDKLITLLHLVGKDEVLLCQAIQFYTHWHHGLERGYLDSWAGLLALLSEVSIEQRRLVFSQTFSFDFESMYFRSLLLICGISSSDLSELTEYFQRLGGRRFELLAILSSVGPRLGRMDPNALMRILEQIAAGHQNLEVLFSQFLPEFEFKYFSSAVDYGLVLERMALLLKSVKLSLDFFLGDKRFFIFAPPVKKLLSPDALRQLQDQYSHLQAVELELQRLSTQHQDFDFHHLFSLFAVFDQFFLAFVEQHLGRIFIPILFHLLPRLDPKLQPNSSLKQLMKTVLDQHQKIAATSLAEHLKPEMLKILVDDNGIPLMQRFLQKFLVDDLMGLLAVELVEKLKDSQVPEALRQKLSSFLHQLPLNVEALNQFFLRYQGIRQVIGQWLALEQELLALHLHPELPLQVFKHALEAQLPEGQPYFSGHWHLTLQVLKQLIRWLQVRPCPYFSIPNFLTIFYQQKAAVTSIDVLGNGDLNHPHLALLWSSLDEWFGLYLTNPLSMNLLPQALDAILLEGKPYDYCKGLEMYQQMGGNSPLMTRLLAVMGQEALVAEMLAAIQTLDALPGDGMGVVNKLFLGVDFQTELADGYRVLDWLLQHRDYPWLEMIADDENFCFAQLKSCINSLSLPSPWVQAYVQNKMPQATEEETILTEPKQSWWSWLFGARTVAPVQTAPRLVQEDPNLVVAKQAWTMWSEAPYPSFVQLNHWLSSCPLDCQAELLSFDCYPRGAIEAYVIREQSICAWMDELSFYGRAAIDKSTLALHLKTVIALINQALTSPRQDLVQRFHHLHDRVQEDLPEKGIMHQLLSVIAALYCKTTGRKPYPTQILTLLVTLETMDKNLVFEVDTGEGKGVTTALMAVLKWVLKKEVTIEIHTANRDLVKQDYYAKGHWRFFQSLGIVHQVIQEDSPLSHYQPRGIYYSTQDDMAVFKELFRLQAQQALPTIVEVIVDEVDHVILDQTMLINLSIPVESKVDWFDLYQLINQFIDKHWLTADHHSWRDWVQKLKAEALTFYQGNKFRQGLLLLQPFKQWMDWIEVAVYGKLLQENRDYIVEAIELGGRTMYQVLPYMKSEIKYGFDLSYQSKSGLKALLHARLHSAERSFTSEPMTEFITQLSPNYLADVTGFIGLTGSLGSVGECREIKEALFANLVRIPRFFPSKLEQAPPRLMKNPQHLLSQLVELLQTQMHPVLICVPEIEAAQFLYLQLSLRLNHRTIRLLTGQESQWRRSRWLQASKDGCYAGTPGAITIATLICGRGTDIVVEPPHYLAIYQWGVLEPRHTMQLKGRTARNNQPGTYQLLLDSESLGAVVKKADLAKFLAGKQYQLILESRQQRLMLRMKSWLRKYILEILRQTLTQISLSPQEQMLYCASVVAAIGAVQVDEVLNPQTYFGPAKMILQTAMGKLVVKNLIRMGDQEERLMDCLTADKGHWAAIIPQVLVAIPSALTKSPTALQFCSEDYQFFIAELNLSGSPRQSWYQRFFYPLSDLEKISLGIVQDACRRFESEPQAENFQIFYTSLVSAQKLYQQRQQQHRFAKYYSPLAPWADTLEQLQISIQLRKVLQKADIELWPYLKTLLADVKLPVLRGWKLALLRFFYPNLYHHVCRFEQDLRTFSQVPSPENLSKLMLHLNQLVEYYHALDQSWWNHFWLQKLMLGSAQMYFDLQSTIPGWVQTYIVQGPACQDWFQEQQAISEHQLAYRQGIVNELKVSRARGAQGLWRSPLSENLTLAAELDELGRIFPQQINTLYAQFYQTTAHHLSQHPRRWVLLAVLRAYFSPFNAKLTLDLIGQDFKVLLGEFDRWSHARQLLVEWDTMNPSLS